MRAIYYLRTIGGAEAIQVLSDALRDKRGSPLLRHELAYVLGQLRDETACGVLEEVLCDAADNVMVRHEAAEALGAIGAERSLPLLTFPQALIHALKEITLGCQPACRVTARS